MATAPKTSSSGGALLLDEIDDYLAPSQACINPLFQPKDEKKKKQDVDNSMGGTSPGGTGSIGGNVVIPRRKRRTVRRVAVDGGGGHVPSTTTANTTSAISSSILSNGSSTSKKDEDPVKASMADCLACSGCVTTAETVLLEQEHSLDKLRAKCLEQSRNQNHVVRVLTISPSSWADLFRHLNMSTTTSSTTDVQQIQRKVVTLMNQIINVNLVIDGMLALQWSLDESAKEFCEMYTSTKRNGIPTTTAKRITIPDPSIPIDSTQTTYYTNGTAIIKNNNEQPFQNSLPLVSGSCPAVVCLVEKSKQSLVTNLATSKSPMAMTGAILREKFLLQQSGNFGFNHWAIMPCHDKKLEASRKDFTTRQTDSSSGSTSATTTQKDIELVITTKEWYHLIRDWVSSKVQQQQHDVDTMVTNSITSVATNGQLLTYIQSLPTADVVYDELPKTQTSPSTIVFATSRSTTQSASSSSSSAAMTPINPMVPLSSGGHADYIFRYAARQLFQCNLDQKIPIWKPVTGGATQNSTGGVIRSARMAKRNKMDFYEAMLYRHRIGNGFGYSINEADSSKPEPVLRFAIANGLQTLQRAFATLGIPDGQEQQGGSSNMVESRYDYVEAMACPSGCVNGGGQLRVNDDQTNTYQATSRETPTQTRQRVAATQAWLKLTTSASTAVVGSSSSTSDDMMDTSDEQNNMDSDNAQIDSMMDIDGDGMEQPSHEVSSRRTRYHVVPQMKYGLGAAAGVAVEDIQW